LIRFAGGERFFALARLPSGLFPGGAPYNLKAFV
jgi:hypothetical protein